jgi:hypothetical protein
MEAGRTAGVVAVIIRPEIVDMAGAVETPPKIIHVAGAVEIVPRPEIVHAAGARQTWSMKRMQSI